MPQYTITTTEAAEKILDGSTESDIQKQVLIESQITKALELYDSQQKSGLRDEFCKLIDALPLNSPAILQAKTVLEDAVDALPINNPIE